MRSSIVVAALVAAVAADEPRASAQSLKFYQDDPLDHEVVTRDLIDVTRYEPDLVYENLVNLFGQPGDPVLGQKAKNVNTIDEVPDGPFYVNRAGRMALTPEMVARGANSGTGPADGVWTVISAKSDGITPGFTLRDEAGAVWFVKFDPPGHRAMATGSEIVGAKLFWALGYHTTEYYIARLDRNNLRIGESTMITPAGQRRRPMRDDDIDWLLRRADRDPDGTYRIIASKAAPGRPVGRIRFHGTRADDPNDLIPHEHRRELRGYFVFAAWLNHVDAKNTNSLASLVTENDRTFIRRYLLDFGSILGSGGIGPREGWQGFETLVEPPKEILKRTVTFGLRIPEWRTRAFHERPTIGRVPRDHTDWHPERWQPHVTNAAFRHARSDDKFWAATKLAAIDEAMVRAAVAEAKFDDEIGEELLVEMIMARRERILSAYLPAVHPVVDARLVGGHLRFRNVAVDEGVSDPPRGYRASWFRFDNASGATESLGETEGLDPSVPAPHLPDADYLKIDLTAIDPPVASWEQPVSLYFRRGEGESWSLTGLERSIEWTEPGAPR